MPAILLYVGSRGRSFKEAQANISLLLFVRVSLIPIVADVPAAKEPAWLLVDAGVGAIRAAHRARCAAKRCRRSTSLQSCVVPLLLTAARVWRVLAHAGRAKSVLAGK